MSWDIVLFHSKQKIDFVEDIDEDKLVPTSFCSVFESHFKNIAVDDNHRSIRGKDFDIDYFYSDEPASNMILNLYGGSGYL